ncbi:MAG: tripartite tricarboxylate transporter substrate binding protein [Moorella humiferrea]|nr:tripartite tricarboxylate transporter substrate binding protein [Moorella humiferrea]
MNKQVMRVISLVVLFLGLAGLISGCGNQEKGTKAQKTYPEKPIELVVPFSAGGGSDVMARTIVKVITDKKLVAQPITVTNKPGGSGSIGYSYVAQKKGDPYELATVSSNFYTAPLVGQSPVSYKDFTPIAGLATDTLILLVRADAKYKSLQDLINEAKARPEQVSCGGTGGTADDLLLYNILQKQANIKMKYVPFEGGGNVMTALLGGHIDMAWANPSEALAQIKAGKLRALVAASENRLADLTDVPTLKEQGINVTWEQYRGIVAPLGIPQEVVKYWEDVFAKLSDSPEWKNGYIKENMLIPKYVNSVEFGKALEETTARYREAFRELGVLKEK